MQNQPRQQFRHNWAAGKTNLAYSFVKHHLAMHHQATRGTFLTDIADLRKLQKQHKGYAVRSTPHSKRMLDRSGQPKSVRDYKKTLTGKKPLSAKARLCARCQSVITDNMLVCVTE